MRIGLKSITPLLVAAAGPTPAQAEVVSTASTVVSDHLGPAVDGGRLHGGGWGGGGQGGGWGSRLGWRGFGGAF